MFIFTQSENCIVNSDYIDHITTKYETDAAIIRAGLSNGTVVTLGRYKSQEETKRALYDLFNALVGGMQGFYMSDSVLFNGQSTIKDARVKRKGGS